MQAPQLRPPLSLGRRVSHACCRAGCRAELGGRHAAAPAATRLHLCPGLVHPNVYVAAVFDYIDAVEVCAPFFSVWIWGSISMELSWPSIFISDQKPGDLVPISAGVSGFRCAHRLFVQMTYPYACKENSTPEC
ncbi:unnamed protein product [Miscanthus lutarioriparius]|uniref:Uncharacterized protein n=1 Tax=Miscanthus lutarioriparius TaxID=422564 RepID=A0A811NI53_9POAL|nr:unnamed protein product [Miscanthus lutarioriparius]